jgi:hypothetical protein
MFKGTLRTNLDPFHKYSDQELVSVLKRCLLESLVDEHMKDMGLSHPVDVFGVNFSLGQQQLICLARAMLTPSKLLLLDEATAALDSDTDAKVQKVLRANFADRTIMTIAHRLDTIIDSDRILTMDAGKVAEFDSPATLLSNPKSIFAELCKNSGPEEYERLRRAAVAKGGNGGGVPQHMGQPGFGGPQHMMGPDQNMSSSMSVSSGQSMQVPPFGFGGPVPTFRVHQQMTSPPLGMQPTPMQMQPPPMHLQPAGPTYSSGAPLMVTYGGQPFPGQQAMVSGQTFQGQPVIVPGFL